MRSVVARASRDIGCDRGAREPGLCPACHRRRAGRHVERRPAQSHARWRSRDRKTEDELKADKARDDAYKAGIAKIPEQKAKSDPWGNLRSAAPQPKPTAQKPTPK